MPAGTVVTLSTRNIAATVLTYIVFVQAWTDAGRTPIASWHPDVLQSTGAVLTLVNHRGYDLVLKALVSADASIESDVAVNGKSQLKTTIDLPVLEGPLVVREWSIVVQ